MKLTISILKSKEQQGNILLLIFLSISILVMNFYRFSYLETSPPGFYIDEATGGIHAFCISQTLRDAWQDNFLPLFFQADTSGIHGPFYIYPLSLWGSLFGFSIFTLRLFSSFMVFLGIIGVYFVAKNLFNKEVAFYSLLLSSLSPWAFHNSKLSWDASLMPTYTILGVLFFLKKEKKFYLVLSLFFFIAALYTYAASRVTVPLLLFLLSIFCFREIKKNKLSYFLYYLSLALFSLPILYSMKYGLLSSRIEGVSIFSKWYREQNGLVSYLDVFFLYLKNLGEFLNINFLLFDGDYINYRHSTKLFGALSWPEFFGLILVIPTLLYTKIKEKDLYLKERNIISLLLLGILAGLSPSALTWDSLPHALRASSAWPFFCILSAYGIYKLTKYIKYSEFLVCMLSGFFIYKFLYAFYFIFPVEGASFFDVETKELALKAKTKDDWKLNGASGSSRRMYMHFIEGESCTESKKRVYD